MLNWSQARLLATLGVATAVVMEPVSWLTSGIPPCIVNPENYGSYYASDDECPTFHVFLFKLLTSIFEKLGDPNWVIAIFTVVLAGSTIGLWLSTNKLWDAGEKQIRQMGAISLTQDLRTQEALRLAREEFLSTHRPLLIIRRIAIRHIDGDKPRAIEFAVANIGTTAGNLLGGIAKLDNLPDSLPEPSYGNQDQVFTPRKFEPGATDQYTAVARFAADTPVLSGHSVHLVGYMVYSDGKDSTRTTYFCRRYVRERRRFDIVGDPDYESND